MPGVCCPAAKESTTIKPSTPTPLKPVTQSYRPSTTTKQNPPKVITSTVVPLETQSAEPLGQLLVNPEGEKIYFYVTFVKKNTCKYLLQRIVRMSLFI